MDKKITAIKKCLCSYNGAYNPSIEKKRLLQQNKNPIRCVQPDLENKKIEIISIHVHSFIFRDHRMNKTTLQNGSNMQKPTLGL